MSKNRRIKESEGQKLINAWEEIVERFSIDNYELDLKEIKRLIFDTYTFFYKNREQDSVPREELEIYKYVGQFSFFWYYPNSWTASMFDTCIDFAQGLCCAIENGFKTGYLENSLPLGLTYHVPGGCAAPEADMTSYETYEKAFHEELAYQRERNEEI